MRPGRTRMPAAHCPVQSLVLCTRCRVRPPADVDGLFPDRGRGLHFPECVGGPGPRKASHQTRGRGGGPCTGLDARGHWDARMQSFRCRRCLVCMAPHRFANGKQPSPTTPPARWVPGLGHAGQRLFRHRAQRAVGGGFRVHLGASMQRGEAGGGRGTRGLRADPGFPGRPPELVDRGRAESPHDAVAPVPARMISLLVHCVVTPSACPAQTERVHRAARDDGALRQLTPTSPPPPPAPRLARMRAAM